MQKPHAAVRHPRVAKERLLLLVGRGKGDQRNGHCKSDANDRCSCHRADHPAHSPVSRPRMEPSACATERVRAPNTPSVAVDSTGTVYAAWSDCRFRAACTANDIVL